MRKTLHPSLKTVFLAYYLMNDSYFTAHGKKIIEHQEAP